MMASYTGIVNELQPPQAVAVLNDRVVQIGRLNNAIADWLQERRRLEEQYSIGLRRLAQRQIDLNDLGVFATPWSTLMGSADTLADSHSIFATRIGTDVERPLREFNSNNREMSAMSTVQGNLQALANDVDKAQQKTEKSRGKGEANKIASATSELDSAQSHWQSQAPYHFGNLQSLDEARIGILRDALTQFQTHEMDQIERNRVSGEQCLNVLLNVETADEIKNFASRAAQGKNVPSRAQRNSIAQGTPTRGLAASAVNAPAQVSSQSQEDLSQVRSNSTDEKQKGRLKGGLRRFGTVMGRKRESKMPVELPTPTESPAPRPRPSPLSSFGGRFRSKDHAQTLDTMPETSPRERPRSPPRLGSEIFQSPSETRGEPITPPPLPQRTDSAPQVNGTSLGGAFLPLASTTLPDAGEQSEPRDVQPSAAIIPERKESLAALEGRTDGEGFSIPQRGLDPITQAQQDAAISDDGSAPQFNVNIRDAPIQDTAQAPEADLASAVTKLQAPPPSTKRTSTVRGRRQDRNSFVNNASTQFEQAISESEPQDSPFARSVASEPQPSPSTLQEVPEPPPIQTAAPVVPLPGGIAGTGLTQSPSSTFAPGQLAASTFSPFTPQTEQPSPFRPDSQSATSIDQPRTDTQSVRSATTTGSQGPTKHPDFTESGLNSSVVETVSARFENGKLTSSSLIGEIALAYNPADFSSPFGNENIRLENFSSLEKVAPNPAFVKPLDDREGEYVVSLSSIARTQVAFKYQARLDDAGSQVPLLITPAFKIEQNQCSVILSYSLNPAFDLHGQESISLSNVMLALSIEGTKSTGCLSRPVGTYSREKSLIYWQLNEITLTPGAQPEKLLARFTTESEASGGSVEAKWEVTGTNAASLGSGLSVGMQSAGGATGDGSDPFADSEGVQSTSWQPVQGSKRVVGGMYVAK